MIKVEITRYGTKIGDVTWVIDEYPEGEEANVEGPWVTVSNKYGQDLAVYKTEIVNKVLFFPETPTITVKDEE